MKRRAVLATAALAWCLSLAAQANAVTAWYQPTPFPNVKADGTSIDKNNIAIVHALEGWISNYYYGQTFQRTNEFQIGGDGVDYEMAFLKFDLTGLPQHVDSALLYLMPFAVPSPYTSTAYTVCTATSAWDSTMTWATLPSYTGPCYGYAAPVAGSWSGVWLAYGGSPDWYNQWKSGSLANNGIILFPQDANAKFDAFYSTLYNSYPTDPYADGRRPALQLSFTPSLELKLPLPGASAPQRLRWLLTNEIGGYECMGAGGSALWPDVAHTDSGVGNYYSIDISWVNKNENNQPSQYGQYNTPVLAAAGGVVAFAGGTDGNTEADHDPNGFYIVIDHDYAQDPKIGFTTRYLHLKELPRRANGTLLHVGDTVNQGDQIGTVGSTGWYFDSATGTYKRSSTAEHLHFGVRYQDHGYSSIPELSKVVMEGLILKSYQTECSVNTSGVPTGRIRYYDSTNVPTGN